MCGPPPVHGPPAVCGPSADRVAPGGAARPPVGFRLPGRPAPEVARSRPCQFSWLQNGGEASALFCWAFLLLVFTGPGALALEGLLPARTSAQQDERRPEAVTVSAPSTTSAASTA